MAIDDGWAHSAMRARKPIAAIQRSPAAHPGPRHWAASSRSAAIAARGHRRALGLDHDGNVLVIVSEGATDPALWSAVVQRP